ncbi:hypothetical protein [Polluticoccus soli]|uniref:hypothetical protein n=1 Tax=Polluticoccus soli TaxID=3034150 RepID=UPI0023E0BFBF|nr:hypothetical protein [Flavipsychrobacter sp. JY13-12]
MRCAPLYLLLLCLLSSCQGNTEWGAVPEDKSIPPRTQGGADILVARLDKQAFNPEVYREVVSGLFDDEDVILRRSKFILPGNGDSMGYMILTDRHPGGSISTSILMELRVDKPELNTAYRLAPESRYTVHSISAPTKQYMVDTNASMIRFLRLDDTIAAGEFAFIAIELTKETDTVRMVGYFDIPFSEL